ncbi:pyrimidine 5'-nucleotidase [Bowmanella yangjiangensis]|uniref:Pyrimidine 5'-nucleotidase n=1 Tax=Bowmanella yangjiangensis TaxID=2811230 RepID=A0ABS3CPF3_9ALTE|nr:pyrimidine 5'-nucleotidase [Bowmanella yangjiangensis]MBN7818580.1 pyrimidine 5'-nucleotidase [Bowmanella yangjiangensis]
MQYPWILFDADDTLFDFDAFAGLKLAFSRFEQAFEELDFKHFLDVSMPLWRQYQDGEISSEELQRRRFAHWADKHEMCPGEINTHFVEAMGQTSKLLPGARELLDALSGKATLGIITNGFTRMQQMRLDSNGVSEHFHHLVISEQIGVAKPHKGIFEHTLALLGNPPKDQVLMVGDNPHADVLGGLNAGIHTCWLNVEGQVRPEGIDPHYEITDLFQLKKLLVGH